MPLVSTTVYLDGPARGRGKKFARLLGRSFAAHVRRGLELANDEALEEMKAIQRARMKAHKKRAEDRAHDDDT